MSTTPMTPVTPVTPVAPVSATPGYFTPSGLSTPQGRDSIANGYLITPPWCKNLMLAFNDVPTAVPTAVPTSGVTAA